MLSFRCTKKNFEPVHFKKAVEQTLSSSNPAAKCSSLVRHFIRNHSIETSKSSKPNSSGKLHEMFLYLMGLCEKCQVTDNAILKLLLDCLHQNKGNFEFIWLLTVMDFKSWQLLIGDTFFVDMIFKHQRRLQVFEYILYHATIGCLTYDYQDSEDNRYDNQSLVDLPWLPSDAAMGLCKCPLRPIYLVALFKDVEALRLLFQYGASVSEDDICVCCKPEPIHLLEVLANSFQQRITAAYQKDFLNDIYHRELAAIECLLLFLSETPYSSCLWFRLRSLLTDIANTLKFQLEPPESPPSLKDICRRVVRSTLRKKWSLPFGISKLGLPQCLRSYLEVQRFYIC